MGQCAQQPPRPAPTARHYHANLSPEEREAVQRDWTNGLVPIIVATVAFGERAQRPGWHASPPAVRSSSEQLSFIQAGTGMVDTRCSQS